jgi:two-component system chemotaxis response regulator CheY
LRQQSEYAEILCCCEQQRPGWRPPGAEEILRLLRQGDAMKILIADDSLAMRRITEHRLKSIGYSDVIHADSGFAVLAALQSNPDVDVVLLDWNMPAMNGIECLRAIKSIESSRNVHVVMVTAENVKSKIVEAVQSGACNYLIKPFEAKKMHEVLAGIRIKRGKPELCAPVGS